jgi:hypothetical protein
MSWKVEGDQFECRLVQPIDGFGSGEFVRRAGEQPTFQLRSTAMCSVPGPPPAGGSCTVAAGPWRHQSGRAHGRTGVLFTPRKARPAA